jgi:replicative DNA helicase
MLVTGEMNSRELQSRLLSAEARIPSHVMRTGQMSDDEWGRLAHTIKLIADCPIHIATHPDLGMAQLITDVNRLVKGSELKALLIDGLQWITESDASARISAEFTLRRLKILAETAKIPIIITAHAERYSDRYPIRDLPPSRIAQLSHGDAIERVADVVILLDREDQDEPETPRAGEADLIVAKNRNGPTATITVAFQMHYCRFLDMAPNGYVVVPDEAPHASGGEEPA